MKPLGLALLGCGFATKLHSRTLRSFHGVQRYYASRDLARAEACSRRFKGVGHFGSYEAAIDDPRVDAILIATPPSTHLELTRLGLAAGKHVIVEKPPFLSSTDFDRAGEWSRSAGRQLFVAENYFYKPLLHDLREIVTSGMIGEVRIISINALKEQTTGDWRDEEELSGGGALFEGGIHWLSFLANLGLTVRAVHGFRPGSPEGPERTMVVVFEYAEGAVGTLYYSWEIGSPTRGLRLSSIYGSEGAVTFESNGLFVGVRGKKKRITLPKPRDLLGYRAMFEDFFQAIRTGGPPRYDLAAARSDLELVEQVYASLRRP